MLTDEIRSQLRADVERTGIGAVRLLRDRTDLPEGLNYLIVQAWVDGGMNQAREEYLGYVLQIWRSLPDSKWIEITPEICELLRNEAERTGKGPSALFRGLRPSQIGGLNASIVKNWISGGTKSAKREKLEFVMACWRALPDAD